MRLCSCRPVSDGAAQRRIANVPGACQPSRQRDQQRRQPHHPHYLRDDRGVGCLVTDGVACGDDLYDFVDGHEAGAAKARFVIARRR